MESPGCLAFDKKKVHINLISNIFSGYFFYLTTLDYALSDDIYLVPDEGLRLYI